LHVLAVDIEDVPPEPGVEAIWKPDRPLRDARALGRGGHRAALTKATRHLFTAISSGACGPRIVVNVTRGEIIYGDDLLAALDEGSCGAPPRRHRSRAPAQGPPALDPSARDR